MNSKSKERLFKLAAFLDTVKPKAFDLDSIVSFKEYDEEGLPTIACGKDIKNVLREINKGNKEYNCGSTACAIGFLPLAFPRVFCYDENCVVLKGDKSEEYGDIDFEIAGPFFNLNWSELQHLFMPEEYPVSHRSAKYVANRIRSVVKNGFPKHVYREDMDYVSPTF